MRNRLRMGPGGWCVALGLWGCLGAAGPAQARARQLPDPLPPPIRQAPPEPPIDEPPRPPVTVDQLAERLIEMERQNRALAEELERSRREHAEQMRLILDRLDEVSDRVRVAEDPDLEPEQIGPDGMAREAAPPVDPAEVENPVPDYTEGQFAPNTPAPGYPLPSIVEPGRSLLNGSFGPGFRFRTPDGEFRLKVNYESQVEARVWDPSDQQPANSGIYLPRQRIFFSGNITRPLEYEFSINRGFGGLNVLNAYLNLHLDDRLELRMGRFFTPMFYDQYAISNYWLMQPERSVFTTNLSLNRQFGAMAWGYLLDKRLDYAAGVFNGSRNSFEPLNNGLDFVGYLNARPFQEWEAVPAARFLNVGASVAVGNQDQAPVPRSFRIAGGSPSADVPGPATVPFLILNPGVAERGDRLIGSVHGAYFRKGLSLIGEWQYGYGGYSAPFEAASTRVPFSGFYLSGGYFLTGEEVERRSRLYPLRPLFPTREGDRRGIGAWEVTARVSTLQLGQEVFDAGLADRALWSDRATTTEVGANWYWNEYVKVYLFWLHGNFDDPVLYAPGRFQESADMFWLRFQLYF